MVQQQSRSAGMATASLALGIVTVVMSMLWPVAIITGILAIVFGALSMKTSGRGKAIGGVVTGSIGILLCFLVILATFIALPALQRSQRDVARKNDVSLLASQVISYTVDNKGSLPAAEEMSADDLLVVKNVVGSGDPTTETAVYIPGEDCDGAVGARAYALRILLESGSEYCQDNS